MAFDLRPVFFPIGVMLAILGLAMFVPAAIDLIYDNSDGVIFIVSGLITLLTGCSIGLVTRNNLAQLNIRQAFLLTTIAWGIVALFGAIPFLLGKVDLDFASAYFESMSGLTTTGSTVMTNLDNSAPGILMWRSILHWIGGIGVLVMAVSVMPMLQVGGMQFYRTEGFYTAEKILPRAAQISVWLVVVYLLLTMFCAIGYVMAGMTWFDGAAHAMSTIATGGFSTKDESIGYYDSAVIDIITVFFMIMAAMPFIHYISLFRGNPDKLWRDVQVRTFLSIIVVLVSAACLAQIVVGVNSGWDILLYSLFNVVSILTGTGYSTFDYSGWGGFANGIFFCACLIGGCAGSTSCGIKIFRFQMLYGGIRQNLHKIIYPHGNFIRRLGNRNISSSTSSAVMSFIFLYFAFVMIFALLLRLTGVDDITALSGSAALISNVGPGLGDVIGPAGNFSSFNTPAKYIGIAAMLLGRLELFAVLVLFVPRFWRN